MQKLLLLSNSNEGIRAYLDTIERKLSLHTTVVRNTLAVKTKLQEKVFHLFVIDTGTVTQDTLNLIADVRQNGGTFAVLVLAVDISRDILDHLEMLPNVHLILRPFHEKSLMGIVRKLLVSKSVPKQVFRRFNTNQIAELEPLSAGGSLLTSMYNLSKGGAYCEFDAADMVAVGDIVRMKVALNDTQSEYVFNAKVVWTTPKGKFSGRFGCGVRFVSSKDSYRALLSKV